MSAVNQVTIEGQTFVREEKLWVEALKGFVHCAPYDEHFVYYTDKQQSSAFMCTCGSVAVAANVNGDDYKNQGLLLVCLLHAQTGLHQTGGARWI